MNEYELVWYNTESILLNMVVHLMCKNFKLFDLFNLHCMLSLLQLEVQHGKFVLCLYDALQASTVINQHRTIFLHNVGSNLKMVL